MISHSHLLPVFGVLVIAGGGVAWLGGKLPGTELPPHQPAMASRSQANGMIEDQPIDPHSDFEAPAPTAPKHIGENAVPDQAEAAQRGRKTIPRWAVVYGKEFWRHP